MRISFIYFLVIASLVIVEGFTVLETAASLDQLPLASYDRNDRSLVIELDTVSKQVTLARLGSGSNLPSTPAPTPATTPTPTITPTPATTTSAPGSPVKSSVVAVNNSGPAIATNIVTAGPTPTSTQPPSVPAPAIPLSQPTSGPAPTNTPAQQPSGLGPVTPPVQFAPGSNNAFGNIFAQFPGFDTDFQQGFGANFGGNFFSEESLSGFFGSQSETGLPPAESVIGPDERVEVQNTDEYPFRAIGRISVTCGTRKYVCSGTLIGPALVMTAGHCAFTNEKLCDGLTFAPGQKGAEQPYGVIKVIKTRIPAKATVKTNGVDFDSDYALMVLEKPIGDEVGWFSVGYTCSDSVHDLGTAGYPIDLNTKATTMYFSSCSSQVIDACPCGPDAVTCASENTFNHECDTFGGMSGSAVWTIEDGKPFIRAIHVGGFAPSSTVQKNTAVYLNPTIFPFYL